MATKPVETDEFDAAFESFTQAPPVEELAPAAAEEPAPVVAEEPAPAAAEEPAPAAAEEPAPAAAEEPAPAAEEPAASDTVADQLIERLSAVLKEVPTREEPRPEAPVPVPELYTPEETEFLARYEEDWGDVSRGEGLKRQKEYRELVGFVFNQVADQFRPIMEAVDVLANRAQLADLRGRVNDYDDVRDQVIDWVGKQPQYLQTAYNSVIQAGSPDEVVDLIERFRQETGVGKPAPVTTPEKSELSDATKKAVKALAPVSTKRSAVPQAEDDGDYDSAFARFAEVLKR